MTSENPGAPPPRLDFVSPLPPVRSGIADYSADRPLARPTAGGPR